MKDYSHRISHDKYRKKQAKDGVVRFEVLVDRKDRDAFEAMVADVANELVSPKGKRLRMARARSELFNQLVSGVSHEFFELKDQLTILKAKVKALSPTLSLSKKEKGLPIPDSIKSLPDDPQKLKRLLAKLSLENASLRLKQEDLEEKIERYHRINEILISPKVI